jgi:hypothetical protein
VRKDVLQHIWHLAPKVSMAVVSQRSAVSMRSNKEDEIAHGMRSKPVAPYVE